MRIFEALFSTTAWIAFLYFFSPIVTTFVWLITGYWIQVHAFTYALVEPTFNMLLIALLFSLVVLIILVIWSAWNTWRYGGLDRRKFRPVVVDATVANCFNVPLKTVTLARKVKLATVTPRGTELVFTEIESKLLISAAPIVE